VVFHHSGSPRHKAISQKDSRIARLVQIALSLSLGGTFGTNKVCTAFAGAATSASSCCAGGMANTHIKDASPSVICLIVSDLMRNTECTSNHTIVLGGRN